MKPYLKAYDKDGKLLATGHEVVGDRGAVIIANLSPHTTYPAGSFFISWQAEQYETEKVAVPEFTTHESSYKEFAFYFKDWVTVKAKTAYDLAVDNGFTGTEEEWVASIKGEPMTYSGMTPTEKEEFNGVISEEVRVELLDDMVREVMTDNAMGLLDESYKEKINKDVINYIASNSEKYRGKDGEPLKYSDLTTQQKEELKSKITDQAVTDFVLKDGTVTTNKIADRAILNDKLGDNYATVKILEINSDLRLVNREGNYFKNTNDSMIDLPEELGNGIGKSFIMTVQGFSKWHYVQTLYDLTNDATTYVRTIKNQVASKWHAQSDDVKLVGMATDQANIKTQYNLNTIEKYNNEVVPDNVIKTYTAIQDINITGVDASNPVKIWVLCRNYNTWGYRIIIGQKIDGVWKNIIDTGTSFNVKENPTGATDIEFTKNGITLKARIDYRAIPENGRILDRDTMAEEPYFVIRPEKIGVQSSGESGGTAYDQSLNSTDNVRFASIKADSIEVGGELKKGTLQTPPTGLVKGDMWLDTTDSTVHPILRVMS